MSLRRHGTHSFVYKEIKKKANRVPNNHRISKPLSALINSYLILLMMMKI
ncbi:MAG: hypothetical protein ACR5KW_04565 [Wolbachia sp.]